MQGDEEQKHSGGVAVKSPQPPEQGVAGRELDAAIARGVMGLEVWRQKGRPIAWHRKDPAVQSASNRGEPAAWSPDFYATWSDPLLANPLYRNVEGRGYEPVARYSTSIDAAMEIPAKLQRRMALQFYPSMPTEWHAEFVSLKGDAWAWATTPAEAICRAALRAVAQNVPERETEITKVG